MSDQYDAWRTANAYMMGYVTQKAGAFLMTFGDWPPTQLPASFTINYFEEAANAQAAAKMKAAAAAQAPAPAPAKKK